MSWAEKFDRAMLRGEQLAKLDLWLNSRRPLDLLKSPEKLATEFYNYMGPIRSVDRRVIEMTIGAYQNTKARRDEVADGTIASPTERASTDAEPPTHTANVRVAVIAEYIFSQQPRDGSAPMKKGALKERAKNEGPNPDMTDDEFDEAFQRVMTRNAEAPRKPAGSSMSPIKGGRLRLISASRVDFVDLSAGRGAAFGKIAMMEKGLAKAWAN